MTKIRIKYINGSWWAHFNGEPDSQFHSESLPVLCSALHRIWPASKPMKRDDSDIKKFISDSAGHERRLQAKRASDKLAKWKGM